LFSMMFGAISMGNASSYGPNVGAAIAGAVKIFTLTETPTEIDPLSSEKPKVSITESFKGDIEFRDVWFRYPTRKEQWIFKGLNLKINSHDNIAIVGESG